MTRAAARASATPCGGRPRTWRCSARRDRLSSSGLNAALAWLTFPRATRLALLIAAAVGAPTLLLGRVADDYFQLATLQRLTPLGGPGDLYCFGDGHPEHMQALMARGPYPWWTLPELKIRFWRPLSSGLAGLDDWLAHDHVALQHVHSVLWYLALIALAAALLRPLLPGVVGALGLVLFAIDDAHFIPVAWLANRNSLVAMTIALAALLLHVRGREQGRALLHLVAVPLWALALAGGESAIGVMAYAVAYEALAAPGTWGRRIAAIAPVTLVLAGYSVMYRLLGFGAWGSGVYLDPSKQPGLYLSELFPRLLALSGGALLKLPSEVAMMTRWPKWIPVIGGAVALAIFVPIGWRVMRALEPAEGRHVRWLLLGAVLSLLPVSSTFASNRLLLIPSLGGSVFLAAVIRHFVVHRQRVGAAWVGAMHLLSPVLAWGVLVWFVMVAQRFGEEASRNMEVDEARFPTQRAVVLAAPDPLVATYLSLMRLMNGQTVPQAWWPTTFAPIDQRLRRTGPSSFTLELLEDCFFHTSFEQLFRGADHPLHKGDRVVLDGLTVSIEEESACGPTRVAYAFDRPLEDPSLALLVWRDWKLRRYVPPPVGEAEVLPVVRTLPILR